MNGAGVTRWLGFHQHRLVAKLRTHEDAASQIEASTSGWPVSCTLPMERMRQTACMAVLSEVARYCANQVCCFGSKL